MPKVLNKHKHGVPEGAVYVGRPSIWGNPFEIGKDGNRAQVIHKYKKWLDGNPGLLKRISTLKGKDLVCWCAPKACHADHLLKLANKKEKDA